MAFDDVAVAKELGPREEFKSATTFVATEDTPGHQTLEPGTFPSLDKFFPEAAVEPDKIAYGPGKPIPAEQWGAQLKSDLEAFKAAQAEITEPAIAAAKPITPGM